GAVVAEQRAHRAGREVERHPGEGALAAVALGELADLDPIDTSHAAASPTAARARRAAVRDAWDRRWSVRARPARRSAAACAPPPVQRRSRPGGAPRAPARARPASPRRPGAR